MSDGTCVPFNSTIAKIVANEGLCPPSEELQPDGTCVYSTFTPGYGTACTVPPPIPLSAVGGPPPGPSPCCLPGQLPATTGVPPSGIYGGSLQYTGSCCPAGQVPQSNGSCLPQEPFINPCPGGGSYNARTSSCCPAGSLIANRYTCCPPNQVPQPSGSCGCPPAETMQSNGSCVPICPANRIPGPGSTCIPCPAGQVGTAFGICCPASQAASNGSCCPSGTHAQGAYCMPGTALITSRPLDDCPPGTTRQDDGTCKMTQPVITPETPGLTTPRPVLPSPPVPSRLCSAGETMLRDGDCCPSGQVTSRGTCCTPPYLPASDGTCRRPPQQRPAESDAPCGIGLLPREAFQSDLVCVTLAGGGTTRRLPTTSLRHRAPSPTGAVFRVTCGVRLGRVTIFACCRRRGRKPGPTIDVSVATSAARLAAYRRKTPSPNAPCLIRSARS